MRPVLSDTRKERDEFLLSFVSTQRMTSVLRTVHPTLSTIRSRGMGAFRDTFRAKDRHWPADVRARIKT